MNTGQTCHDCGEVMPSGAPEGLCPKCLLASAIREIGSSSSDLAEPDSETRSRTKERFGDYQVLECLATGGMGVVYRARHLRLGRVVAIKTLPFGRFTRDSHVRRFRAEAEAASRLRHPHIVAIHEVGEQDGCPWFAMDFVEGPTLAQLIQQEPIPVARAVRWARSIAEALHHAHSQGILHRDLKPSNILVDALDQPLITDFGLAKDLLSDSDLTVSSHALGSPNYMPPEQCGHAHSKADETPRVREGKSRVGPPSDVYGIGAVLYHMLVGRPPFQGETALEVLKQACESEPLSPHLLVPGLPRDVITICLKCLEKDPRSRYSTALEVAEELARWQASEPILARPISAPERAWRWCRRRPALAAALAVVLGLLTVLGIGGPVAAVRIDRARTEAKEEAQRALTAAAQAKAETRRAATLASHLELQRIEGLFESGETTLALAGLARVIREDPENANATERLLSALTWQSFAVMRRAYPGTQFGRARPSPDWRVVATTPNDGGARLYDSESGRLLAQTSTEPSARLLPEFSSDSSMFATAFTSGVVRVFRIPSLDPVGQPLSHGAPVNAMSFSPDGRWLATGCDDQTARSGTLRRAKPVVRRSRITGRSSASDSVMTEPGS